MDYGCEICEVSSTIGMGDMEVKHIHILKSMLTLRKQTISAPVYIHTPIYPVSIILSSVL